MIILNTLEQSIETMITQGKVPRDLIKAMKKRGVILFLLWLLGYTI